MLMKAIFLISTLFGVAATVAQDEGSSYFPISTKSGGEGVTAFEAQWYGKALERMKEPRLPELAKDATAEVYRMTILPTWGNRIVVRARKEEGRWQVFARRLDGQGGYDPGKLVEEKDFALSEHDAKTLEVRIQNLKLFELPSTDGEL